MNKDNDFPKGGFISGCEPFNVNKGESVIAKKMIIRPEDLKYMLQLEDIARKAKSRKRPARKYLYCFNTYEEITEKVKAQNNANTYLSNS